MKTFSIKDAVAQNVKSVAAKSGAPFRGAELFVASETPAGFTWDVAPGTFSENDWLSFDFMVDDPDMLVFELHFHTSVDDDKPCILLFAGLPYAQARLRFPVSHVDQRIWGLGREGMCIKRICAGRAIAPADITRFSLLVTRKAPGAVRWWQCVQLSLSSAEPALLKKPFLSKGALLDELGQSTTRKWRTKTPSFDALKKRLESQAENNFVWSDKFSKWGGDATRKWKATGFFRTTRKDGRWWLVDPDGHPFWSAGMDCVNAHISNITDGIENGVPKSYRDAKDVNSLERNFKRVFGADWKRKWDAMTPGLLRSFGINTVGNWSDKAFASAARFSYVMPLPGFNPKRSGTIFREFPDVFHPGFEADAEEFAKALEPVRDDNALIGYFLMNEPTWGFAAQTPAEGMLTLTESARARDAFADWLAARHGADPATLATAWKMPGATLAKIRKGLWPVACFTERARKDLEAFSELLCAKLFDTLSAACKRVAPHHLNLGARYYTVPPRWALRGMAKSFDVFSINGYSKKAPQGCEEIARVAKKPVMIGEWHFGALDAGLPASGIGHVRDQNARGAAYRYYIEQCAAQPWCVGAHWFTLYDQSAIGRFDGEAYNIGFLDVCNRPYAPICAAAAESFARIYDVARGATTPFNEPPEYLPLLFC